MTGRTNAGGGSGGGSAFLAYLQVATDANAEITAVNLAGDTFSGTADSTGALVLNITEPGTYTVTETDGGIESIVIADNGETYQLTVVSFDGTFVVSGVASVTFDSIAQSGTTVPISSSSTISGETALYVQQPSGDGAGIWLTENAVEIAEYSSLVLKGAKGTSATLRVAYYDEENTLKGVFDLLIDTSLRTYTYSLNLLDKTKKYKFGFILIAGNSVYIVDFRLQ